MGIRNTNKKAMAATWIAGIVIFAVLLILDRVSKNMAVANLMNGPEKQLIGDLFVLHYLENTGAAFGILQGKRSTFLIIAVIVLIVIFFFYVRIPYRRRFLPLRVVMAGIAAGAIGNMIDRFTNGYVVDFLYIKVIDFPVFNVADIYVTCSCILLILFLIFVYKDSEFSEMADAVRFWKKQDDQVPNEKIQDGRRNADDDGREEE